MIFRRSINFLTDPSNSVKRLSISPLMGSRFFNLLKILSEGKCSPTKYISLVPVIIITFILELLRLPIYIKTRIKIKKDKVQLIWNCLKLIVY